MRHARATRVASRDGSAARGGRTSARRSGSATPARLAPASTLSTSAVLGLQRTAGNAAVSSLLTIAQRDDTDDITVAGRIKQAKGHVDRGDIDAGAWDKYRERGGSEAGVVERVWLDELALPDVDPKDRSLKPAERVAAQALLTALRTRVSRALQARFTALQGDLPKSKDRIEDQVEAAMNAAPTWSEGTIADRLWEAWVGPFEITSSSPSGATPLWSALKAAGAPFVGARRKAELAKDAVKDLDSGEIAAVESALDHATAWVVTPEDTERLTDQVAGALGHSVVHTDAGWIALHGRMARLVLVAETNLINKVIPQESPVWPERWALFRNRYVATITKPMWTYWRDNIVDATVLGTPVHKSDPGGGVHKDVKRALPLVEQSAMRLGGFSSVDELRHAPAKRPAPPGALHGKNPITLPGTEFRFEAVSHEPWMSKASHLSFHGTGRAIDFRSSTNPAIQGPVHELISVLGGDELSELPATSYRQRSDLASWAGREAEVLRMREALADRARATTDPDEQATLVAQIKRIDEQLEDAPQSSADAATVRDRVTETFNRIEQLELNFQVAWDALRAAAPTDAELVQLLLQTVDQAAAEANDALTQAKAAKAPGVGALEGRVKRIAELRAQLADARTRGAILSGAGAAAQSGLTDLPLWFIQAFTEQGWQWGEWPGFSDAMHFDYMGPVEDVITQ